MRTAVGIALLLAASCPAFGDPGPTVQYLMATPPSLFTYGIDKLEAGLTANLSSAGIIGSGAVKVMYDWDKNKITLLIIAEAPIEALTDTECVRRVKEVKRWLLVDPDTGARRAGGMFNALMGYSGAKAAPDYFRQSGYSLATEPKDFDDRLEQIVTVDFDLSVPYPGTKLLRCWSELRNAEINFVGPRD